MNKMAENKRNGKIELMRFVFAIVIFFFHTSADDMIDGMNTGSDIFSFFRHGNMGVEFFFLVSGYLLAASAYKLKNENSISKNTFVFTYKKITAFFGFHIVAWIFAEISWFVLNRPEDSHAFWQDFVMTLPSLFLIQKTGFKAIDPTVVEWYLSVLIVCSFVLFALVLRFKKNFTRIAAPVLGILLVGALCRSTGDISGVFDYVLNDSVSKAMVRGFSEMCLGIFSYEIVQYVKNLNVSKCAARVMSAVEIGAYLIVFYYIVSKESYSYEPYALLALFVAVTLSFSNITFSADRLQNKLVYTLGKLSLPIYLAHRSAIRFTVCLNLHCSYAVKVLVSVLITAVFCVVVHYVGMWLTKLIKNKFDPIVGL